MASFTKSKELQSRRQTGESSLVGSLSEGAYTSHHINNGNEIQEMSYGWSPKDMVLLIFREINIDVRKKHQMAAFHTRPDQGLSPQPFGVWDDTPTN